MVQTRVAVPWWVNLIVLVSALLSAAGAILALVRPAMLVGPGVEIGAAAHIFAGYFAARNLVLAASLVVLLAVRARRALGQFLVLFGVIQFVDAITDCLEARWAVAPGVLLLGILLLIAATKLFGAPSWRSSAWSD